MAKNIMIIEVFNQRLFQFQVEEAMAVLQAHQAKEALPEGMKK